MCIGIPMQVVDCISDTFATCQDQGVNKINFTSLHSASCEVKVACDLLCDWFFDCDQ
jgi:hydrogenase maturation factor